MAPGISLRFLLRSGHGCLPQLEFLRTGRRQGPRPHTPGKKETHTLAERRICNSSSDNKELSVFVGVPVLTVCINTVGSSMCRGINAYSRSQK